MAVVAGAAAANEVVAAEMSTRRHAEIAAVRPVNHLANPAAATLEFRKTTSRFDSGGRSHLANALR